MTNTTNNLEYRDSDKITRKVEGCTLTTDKAGRYWLWCDQLERNLAYKIETKEDVLLCAISSLLFDIQFKEARIQELQRIANLAEKFAKEAFPKDTCDD